MSKPTADQFKAALATVLTDQPIAYHPALAHAGGGCEAGVFLSQLLYWTPRGKLPDGWIWKSAREWETETGLTRYEQKRARKKLKERGIIEEDLRGVPATLHYRVNLGNLAAHLAGQNEPEDAESEQERDALGRFLESPSLPHDGKLPSLPYYGKLDHRDTANKPAVVRQTSLPCRGALSIDYTETTQRPPEIILDISLKSPDPREKSTPAATTQAFEELFGETPTRPPSKRPDRTDPDVRAARINAAHDAYLERQRAEGTDAPDDDRSRIYPRAGISAESLYATHRTLLVAGVPGPSSDARWKRWRPMLVSMYQEAGGDQDAVRAAAQLLVAKMAEGYDKDIRKWGDYISAARVLDAKATPTHHPDHAKYSHPDTPDMTHVDDTDRILAELEAGGGA